MRQVLMTLTGADPTGEKLRGMLDGLKTQMGDNTLHVSEVRQIIVTTDRPDVARVLKLIAQGRTQTAVAKRGAEPTPALRRGRPRREVASGDHS